MSIESVAPEGIHESIPEPPYISHSPWKVALLVVASFGLYALWWFFTQWRQVRDTTGARIYPWARAIFSPIYSFALFKEVEDDLMAQRSRMLLPGVLLGMFYLVSAPLGSAPDPYWVLAVVLAATALGVVQHGINRVEAQFAAAPGVTRGMGFGSGVVFALGGILWAFAIIGGFSTEDRVLGGNELRASQLEYLQSSGYVLPEEEVIYFYSAGLWSIREDGNILTDRRVVAYENIGADQYHEAASYEEIFSVDAIYSDSWLDLTQVIVTTIYNTEVRLLLSPEKGRDRLFVRRLISEWRQRVPEGEERLLLPDEVEAAATTRA